MQRSTVTNAPVYVGVDTGGTFTDLVLLDVNRRVHTTHKLLSTPDDPARAVLVGIDHLLRKANRPSRHDHPPHVIHGSTVATNALIEEVSSSEFRVSSSASHPNSKLETRNSKPNTAFITTAGFEHTLAIARQHRPDLYALVPHRPKPPIPTDRCLGVPERIAHDGRVLQPLNQTDIDTLIEQLRNLNVTAVAISLLHSYANPQHERRIADALRDAFGRDLHLTVSHELLPEYREYERAATCVVNAVVAPKMVRYLDRLTHELGEANLRIMASHGGTLPPDVIRNAPVRTVLSGPAGGVLGAAAVAKHADVEGIISFDMGGTSTDVALCDPKAVLTSEGEAGDLPVRLPMIDMHTVGAGGGSIAWLDPGGALRVGPQSAGANPGPACYGRQQPDQPLATVTDAHVALGHLPTDISLGEDLAIDRARAEAAVHTIATRANLALHDTAAGILRIAEATMARAVHRISLQRGRDPRRFTLVPFGGAGGLHACRLADAVGITRVLVPQHAGLLSAVGMLGATPTYTFSHALLVTVQPDDANLESHPAVQAAFATLKQQADAAMANENLPDADRLDHRAIDMRYLGQSYEITVPFDHPNPIARFLDEHQRLYGYTAADKPIELVAARWQASGREQPVNIPPLAPRNENSPPPATRDVTVHEGEHQHTWHAIPRDALRANDRLPPRTIITEYSATTLIPPDWHGVVNTLGQLMLKRQDEHHQP
ncbi:hydantoinase/oxoprolinase family protein [Phycisphaerales bacterium AB-hyl4]|uniref:Hydantoinase/oxoprolinase family protein n=1 Tax=Natronomicrosphaera hydrolytica TaxID=3242702 RepID=A0ABV4U7J3_9BACT